MKKKENLYAALAWNSLDQMKKVRLREDTYKI